MGKNSDIIISTYKQADRDAEELIKYIESISRPEEFCDSKLPTLVRNLENKDSAVALTYIKGASIMGGSVASTVGSSILTGILASTIYIGGIGMSIMPGLNLVLPLTVKLLVDSKVKKYIKENREKLKLKKTKIQKCKEKLLIWLNDIQKKSFEIDEKLQEKINIKFIEYKDKTKKFARDISIQIDDCLNVNNNKRIFQYNEVILKQYRLQKDLEEKVDFLFNEYNKLLNQKQELEKQMNCLIKLLNAIGCPESVINQALNEGEA